MATNTYVELDKITVSGTSTASVTFTSISQEYTDLVLIVSGSLYGSANRTSFVIQLGNGSIDTGANYSSTWLAGNGTTAVSSRYSNGSNLLTGHISEAIGTTVVQFMNYKNTSKYKTILARGNSLGQVGSFDVGAFASLWRSTSAINTMKIYPNDGSFYNSGTTFSLYGIKAWSPEVSTKATGGYVYSDSTYYYHSFPFSGIFTPSQSITADVLVVAGGGSGGYSGGAGGGGAGGLVYLSSQSLSATNYTVTVGAGGVISSGAGVNGSNSQFASTTAAVGGGGGGYDNPSSGIPGSLDNGSSGGSGGGGGIDSTARAAGTAGQGNEGGLGKRGSNNILSGGGGGGSGAAGVDAGNSIDTPGAGGNGSSTYSSWGLATQTGENVNGTVYYAGGGAAIGWNVTGTAAGGLGGGGSYLRASGLVSSGGGGLGANGSGGSGIVIVRYAK